MAASRECAVCGATFTNLTDYGVHVALGHDLGIGRSERTPKRPVSCWRCASDININVTTRCTCGFDLAEQPTVNLPASAAPAIVPVNNTERETTTCPF
jgi:hypothetical protein